MDLIRNHPKIIAAILAAGIGLLALFAILSNSNRSQPPDLSQQSTLLSSPFTESSEKFLINYGSDTSPNFEAVFPSVRLFAANSLPLPESARSSLPQALGQALSGEVTSANGTTNVQIDRSTINCEDPYDCRFSFYLDSPESYFSYRIFYNPDGTRATELKRLPLPGANQ